MGTWQKPLHGISTFIESINNYIENLLTIKTTLPKSNVSIQGKLANRDNLIISKADKCGATTIQDTDSYVQEATR